jgi:CheY-like chemotaxis protein
MNRDDTRISMVGSDIKIRFGTAVRTKRKYLGISQEELAGRAGLHRTYIADVERGARNPTLASIEKLSRALELSVSALFSQVPGAGRAAITGEAVDILLVEDDAADAELTMRAFKDAHLTNRVHLVRDGAEALDFLFRKGAHASRGEHSMPDVILLDLNLPRVSGIDVLRRIKNDERTARIPVIVLTGSQSDRDIQESRRLGAEDYIVKPVNFHRFTEVTPQLQLFWLLLKREARQESDSRGVRPGTG